MIDIVALKKNLYILISGILETHDMQAADDAKYPYAVYKLPSSFPGNKDNNQNIQFTMEIHVWDKNVDATMIENLCSSLNNALNGVHVSTTAFFFTIKIISPYQQVPDPNEDIQHRVARYLLDVQFL